MAIASFNPPARTLMGPGPSDIHPRVLQALSRPTIGHLDPKFVAMMDELKELLQYAFQTENALTMPVSAPGSAGMETCLVNLIEPGEKVVVCSNGVFGGRMKSIVERMGATAIEVVDEWGKPVTPQKVEDALKSNPNVKAVAFVHAETSTGASSDAEVIASVAKRHNALVIVDAVTSLGGSPLKVDAWKLDAVYSGSQKCLSCTPGLSPITFSDEAAQAVQQRKTPVQSWFLDLSLVMGYWGSGKKRSYHHTAPVNALYALHESLVMLQEEGLENSWARHAKNHAALKAGLNAMGIDFIVDEAFRLPQLNAVTIPEGTDEGAVRKLVLDRYNLEIGAGLGSLAGKVWRIGQMGYASNPKNITLCLSALETAIGELGGNVNPGAALAAAAKVYD